MSVVINTETGMALDYAEAARGLIEAQLGRSLSLATRTEEYKADARIPLRAWPVESIASIEPIGRWIVKPTAEELNDGARVQDNGVLMIPFLASPLRAAAWKQWRGANEDETDGPYLRITYTAGYALLPPPIQTAISLIETALQTAAGNAGQQITYQALDGYQVTYSSKYQEGNDLTMLSPAAAILIAPYTRGYKS